MKTNHTSFITIACCVLLAAAGCKPKTTGTPDSSQTTTTDRPKMVSSGIGAKFTVPAGQVAIFEVVTRALQQNGWVPGPANTCAGGSTGYRLSHITRTLTSTPLPTPCSSASF